MLLLVIVPPTVSTVRTRPGVTVAELTEYCRAMRGAVGVLVF